MGLTEQLAAGMPKVLYDEFKQGIYDDYKPTSEEDQLYKSFICECQRIFPISFSPRIFPKISQQTVDELVRKIILIIFGNNDEIKEEINSFLNSVIVVPADNILEGYHFHAINPETGIIETKIATPSYDNITSVVTLTHEFIHYYCTKKNLDYDRKRYYTEILSIYAEKIAVILLKQNPEMLVTKITNQADLDVIMRPSKFERKIEKTRLQTVSYLNWDQEIQKREIIESYAVMDKSDPITKELEEALPYLKDTSLKPAFDWYDKQQALSYGYGYIFAENLASLWEQDRSNVEAKIREYFEGSGFSLRNLLDYYGIGINDRCIDIATQRVRSFK